MLSIQDVGLSIMGDSPKSLYFFGGSEYGIKEKYLEILEGKVGSRQEFSDMSTLISMMSRNHIIPLQPHVYVVRYDKAFLSKLNKDLAAAVLNLNIIGVIVGIYDEDKDVTKLDKFFPGNTTSINEVDPKILAKYLKQDFPKMNKNKLLYIAKQTHNYYQARNVARCLNCIGSDIELSDEEISSLFGLSAEVDSAMLQEAIADRDCARFYDLLEDYDGDPTSVVYLIMRTMVELDKVLDSRYNKSPLKAFGNKWTRDDIYNMFQQAYHILEQTRDGIYVDMKDELIWLGALVRFKSIPALGVLQC